MNSLRWVVRTTRDRGFGQMAEIALNYAMDLAFDWRYGTDTMKRIDGSQIETDSANKVHSAQYQATKARPFLELLETLRLPKDCTFVDIGCGKGRVLLIASQYGFDKVVGVEFSPAICAVARSNVRAFAHKGALKSPIEVVEADATQYAFRSDERVLFMYNPFGRPVMAEVLRNLAASVECHPRSLCLIYNNPLHRDLIDSSTWFRSCSSHTVGGSRFLVYRT